MGLDDLLPEKPQLEKDDFKLQEAYPTKLPANLLRRIILQSKYSIRSYKNERRSSSEYYFNNKEIKELKQLTESKGN